jgi:hypothetical protein
MLVNHPIPSFIGGVSQQPAFQRHASQVDEMVNMVPSLASGTRKRTGSQFAAKLGTTDWTNAFVHGINRGTGTSERYFVVIDQGQIHVFDWFGTPKTVNAPDGLAYLTAFSGGSLARDVFGAVTVADYTFIINKQIATAMSTIVPDTITPQYFCTIKLGVAKTRYTIILGSNSYTFETDDGTTVGFKTVDVAGGLMALINTGGLYHAVQSGNLLIINKVGGGDFYGSTTDTYGDQAMFGFKDTVNRYEELPRKFVPGVTVEIKGAPNNSATSWYVEWKQRDSNGDGVWIETIKPNIEQYIWPGGMPHLLIREADGTFTFKQATWDPRLVGDTLSNPDPSFIGEAISDVFFFRNRLGLLSGENAVFSQSGSYFNFFATTARTDVDSDPVDISASTNKVTFLRHAIPFDKSMLIVSDNQQFQLTGGETFTGRTAKLDPTTSFAVVPGCRPTTIGRSVYFATERGTSTAFREYMFDGNTLIDDAADVTAHVPSYIPVGIFKLASSPTENMIFALTSVKRNWMWVYNSFWADEQKAQSAWHRWEFNFNDTIIHVGVMDTTLAMIVQREDGCFLDWLDLHDKPYSPTVFPICLDRWVGYTGTGIYDPGQNRTFWNLPYKLRNGEDPVVVLCNEAGAFGQGLVPDIFATTPGQVSLKGDHSLRTVVIGMKYDGWFQLSEQFFHDAQDKPVSNCRLTLRDITFQFQNSGYFKVQAFPHSRQVVESVYTGKRLGLFSMVLGIALEDSGSFKAPVMSRSDETFIQVHNDSHLPSVFMSAEWQGNVAMQATRR